MINKLNIIAITWSLILGTERVTAMEITSRPTKSMMSNASSKFDILPKEIRHIIIRKLYNIPETISVKISIENAIRYYSSIKKCCPLSIGNKTYTADDLLLLKPKEKEDLIAIAKPSYLQQTKGFSPSLISYSNARKIEQLPEHIRKGLHVDVFHKNPNDEYSDKEITCAICIGIACSACAGYIAPTCFISLDICFPFMAGIFCGVCCLRCTPCSHKISGSSDEIYIHKKKY